MSHSEYDNSPFDSNHDEHIDASEASFIHDTYYSDDSGSSSCYHIGGTSSGTRYRRSSRDIDREVQVILDAERHRKAIFWFGIIIAAMVFSHNLTAGLIILGIVLLAKAVGIA